jgi:hypothetical protein
LLKPFGFFVLLLKPFGFFVLCSFFFFLSFDLKKGPFGHNLFNEQSAHPLSLDTESSIHHTEPHTDLR